MSAMALPLPANETREHFLLKQAGLMWLKERGCQYVATEIDGMYGGTEADEARSYTRFHRAPVTRIRKIADVVGVQQECRGNTIRLIEVKVSRSDFLAGYCTGAHYAYVMTPPGLVDPKELQPGIGLLEIDPDKLTPKRFPKKVTELVKVVRRPKRQVDDDNDVSSVIRAIAAKHTNHAVYKNPWLIEWS